MHLILWRHAEAESGMPDDARALTSHGEQQAARVAQWLAARLPEHCAVKASPARRTQQTARALTRDFETDPALGTAARAPEVLAAAGWPRAGRAVLVVGHQPTLGRAAALALTGQAADWHLKKGGLIWLQYKPGDEEYEVRLRAALAPDLL